MSHICRRSVSTPPSARSSRSAHAGSAGGAEPITESTVTRMTWGITSSQTVRRVPERMHMKKYKPLPRRRRSRVCRVRERDAFLSKTIDLADCTAVTIP